MRSRMLASGWFFFSSRRRHTRCSRDWSSDVCSSDLVDSAAVQDGYQLYHHVFFFTAAGDWCVVQQGMSDENHMARRYHWLSEHVDSFVDEPHEAVCCDARAEVLNLVARENDPIRRGSAELASQPPAVTLHAL